MGSGGGGFRGIQQDDPLTRQRKRLQQIITSSDLAEGEKAEALRGLNNTNLEEVAKRFKGLQQRLSKTKQLSKERTSILTDRPGQRQTILTQAKGPRGSTGGTLLTSA